MAVTLVERYNPAWPEWFEQIKAFLGEKVAGASLRIEHVGSTSVPGMIAKPIIDIIIVIKPERWEEIRAVLEETGYEYRGDQGIPQREVFRLKEGQVPAPPPFHHLYVCPEDSPELEKETAFRDYLETHPKDRERLGALKWELAEKFANDKYPYMDGKDALVKEITEKALKYAESSS